MVYVTGWVRVIALAAKKESDKLYKTIFYTLRLQLYDQSKIEYKQDDQIKAVQKPMDLITKYPPIRVVTRLIDSSNEVTTCKWKPNEDLNIFVSRSRRLAADHLMGAGTNNHSPIEELLAITLPNNSSLSKASLTDAKLSLYSMAEKRAKNTVEGEQRFSLDWTEIKRLLKRVAALRKEIKTFEGAEDPEESMFNPVSDRYNKAIAIATVLLVRQVQKTKEDSHITKAIASNRTRSILRIDDAVTMLQALAQSTPKQDLNVTKSQMNKIVDQKVRSSFGQKANSNDFMNINQSGSNTKQNKKNLDSKVNQILTKMSHRRSSESEISSETHVWIVTQKNILGETLNENNQALLHSKSRKQRSYSKTKLRKNTLRILLPLFHKGSKPTKGRRV